MSSSTSAPADQPQMEKPGDEKQFEFGVHGTSSPNPGSPLRRTLYRSLRQMARSGFAADLAQSLGILGPRVGRVTSISPLRTLTPESGLVAITTLRKGGKSERPQAVFTGGNEPKTFESALRVNHPDFILGTFYSSYVMTSEGWLLTCDRRLVSESLSDPAFVKKRGLENRWLWPRVTEFPGAGLLAYPHWAHDNYYHFLLEFIPRLGITLDEAEARGIAGLRDARILLPRQPSPWMWELMDLMGVERSRCVRTDGRQLRVEKLYFSSRLGQPMNTPAWAIDWLRHRFLGKVSGDSAGRRERLYVSRCHAPKRRVINELEVEQVLRSFGFKTIMPEKLSVQEQIQAFSRAEAVVGPHGAGFSNIVFARKARVLEFFEPSWVWPTYYALGHDCGHDYRGLICSTAGSVDMKVDVGLLRKAVSGLLDSIPQ